MIKIYIASDHAGLELKTKVVSELRSARQYEVHDLGPQTGDSVDYPDFADLVCKKIQGPSDLGILICGSGQGMAMRANKYSHIRAALCWNPEIAKLSREHNDANILCMGGRVTDHAVCLEMLSVFLKTAFAGGRHLQRVDKVSAPVR